MQQLGDTSIGTAKKFAKLQPRPSVNYLTRKTCLVPCSLFTWVCRRRNPWQRLATTVRLDSFLFVPWPFWWLPFAILIPCTTVGFAHSGRNKFKRFIQANNKNFAFFLKPSPQRTEQQMFDLSPYSVGQRDKTRCTRWTGANKTGGLYRGW